MGNVALETGQISVGETDGFVEVTFVRTGDTSGDVTIIYGIEDDTAAAGADYLPPAENTIVMPDGESRVSVQIPINDDQLSETTETFVVTFIRAEGADLVAPRTTRIDILDDENPVVDPPDPPLESPYEVSLNSVISGLTQPIAFEFLPTDPNKILVAEKGGVIKLYDMSPLETGGVPVLQATILDIRDVVNSTGDRGLMDIAIHPDLENNPYLYAFYVVDPPDVGENVGTKAGPDGSGNRFSYVVKYTLDASTGYQTIVADNAEVILGSGGETLSDISGGGLLDFTDPANVDFVASDILDNTNPGDPVFKQDYVKVDSLSHAGGALAFGPDGALYVSTGDGTSYNFADPRSFYVQDIDSLAGKILRIDPLTGEGLTDNPFYDGTTTSNASKVYQLGLRNPFSMGFDADGQLLITDTGWFTWEEINSGGPGANFGWPYYEGGDNGVLDLMDTYAGRPEVTGGIFTIPDPSEIVPAFRSFAHDAGEPGFQFQAIVGGDAFYSGDVYPASLDGYYFFADLSDGEIFAVDPNDRRDVTFLIDRGNGISPVHFSMGPDGYVYYADLGFGSIGRLEISPASEIALEPLVNATEADQDPDTTGETVTPYTFAATLSNAVGGDVVVSYTATLSTPTGTITAAETGQLLFDADGADPLRAEATLSLPADSVIGPDQTLVITLDNIVPGAGVDPAAVGFAGGGTSVADTATIFEDDAPPSNVIASEDFEDGASGWSNPLVTDGGAPFTSFLGRFSGPGLETEKTFDIPAGSDRLEIVFDYYEIDSWDGDNGDALLVFVDGEEIIRKELFHVGRNGNDGSDPQTSGTTGGIAWTVTPLTDGADDLGFFDASYASDQKHRVTLTIDDPGASLTLGFGATIDDGLSDESFGIDNLSITATDAQAQIALEPLVNATEADQDPDTTDETVTPYTFAATLSNAVGGDVVVSYTATLSTPTGTITAAETGQLLFDADGADPLRAEATLSLPADSVIGPDQTLVITLDNIVPGAGVDPAAVGFAGGGTSVADTATIFEDDAPPSNVIASEDFEDGASGWSNPLVTDGGAPFTSFLGRFSGPGLETEKTFDIPAGSDRLEIVFDYYEIDSWDGDNGDALLIFVDGEEIIRKELFHVGRAGNDGSDPQTSGTTGGIAWTVTPLTDGADDLGFFDAFYASDQKHRVTLTIDDPGASITLGFGATIDDGLSDESFGIDNLSITATDAQAQIALEPLVNATEADQDPDTTDETVTPYTFAATLSNAVGGDVVVSYTATLSTPTGTITAAETGQLLFDADGADPLRAEATLSLPADSVIGPDQTLVITLDNIVPGAGVDPAAVGFAGGGTSVADTATIFEDDAPPSNVIASEDFEDGASGWSNPLVTDGGASFTSFLGRFSGPGLETEKTFDIPAGSDRLEIVFDYYEIDSWDGDNGDALLVFVDGDEIIRKELFHVGRAGNDGSDPQTSGTTGGIAWTVTPLTDGADDLGFFDAFYASDQKHRVTLTIDDPGASITLGFGATIDDGLSDESFGIDNLSITASSADDWLIN